MTRLRAYQNDTNQPDANGIPGKGISIVIDGGDATAIATVINLKKGAAGTYGSTMVPVTDDVGITRNIGFFRSTQVQISYAMKVKPLAGYTQSVEAQIKQALADWTSGLGIGNSVMLSRAYAPADLPDMPTELQASPTISDLNRERDYIHQHGGNVMRMLEGHRAADGSYTPAVRRMTLAAARNAIEAYAKTLDAIESEVLPARAIPVAKPFGRRVPDAALPAVASPAGAM